LTGKVKFYGFLPNHEQLLELLAQCDVGLALYSEEPLSYKRFADTGKPKLYIASGLPVIITNVPPIAKLIDDARADKATWV